MPVPAPYGRINTPPHIITRSGVSGANRPILNIRPKVRITASGQECGREVQVCLDDVNPCIYDPSSPVTVDRPGHNPSSWFEDDASFTPCGPPPGGFATPPSPSFPTIPINCKSVPEPQPQWRSGWEQNWTESNGVITAKPSSSQYVYSPKGCWRAPVNSSTTVPPEIVIRREAPKLGYTRSSFDLNMSYEITESEYAYPLEDWVQRQSVVESGLGIIPPSSNNPFAIHYSCPIWGRKSIAKICKIRQGVVGDLLDMRQFSFRSAPYLSTEITTQGFIPPFPGEPKFSNTKNYIYLNNQNGGNFSFTFTVVNVINPVTDVKVFRVSDNSGTYPDFTLPTYLSYNPNTLTISGTVIAPISVTMQAVNTTTGAIANFAIFVELGADPTAGGGDPRPSQVDIQGNLPFLNQDFLVYFPTASAVERDTPTAGYNRWYLGNDIIIEAPNMVRSRIQTSFWRQSIYYPQFALLMEGVLLSGAWGYTPDTTTMFTVNIYTTAYTPAGLYNIPIEMDLQQIPQALEPFWTDEPTKSQVNTDPDAFRARGITPLNPAGLWENNLVRNWPQIGNKIIYTSGFVSFEVTKANCPKPEGQSFVVIDNLDSRTDGFTVVSNPDPKKIYAVSKP